MSLWRGEGDESTSYECQYHSQTTQPRCALLSRRDRVCINPNWSCVLHRDRSRNGAFRDCVVIEEIRAANSENSHRGAFPQRATAGSQGSHSGTERDKKKEDHHRERRTRL